MILIHYQLGGRSMDFMKKYENAEESEPVTKLVTLVHDEEVIKSMTEYYNVPQSDNSDNLFMTKDELLAKLQEATDQEEANLYKELLSYSPCLTDEGNSYKNNPRKVTPNKGDSLEVAYKNGEPNKKLTKKQQEAKDKADKAKAMTQNTQHEKGNAILREAYLNPNKVLDLQVFKKACPNNYMEELLVYLVAEYIQQNARAVLQTLEYDIDMLDIPPSLDHYNGWLGTVNHGAIKDIIQSYTIHEKLQVTLMLTSINAKFNSLYYMGLAVRNNEQPDLDINRLIPKVETLMYDKASFTIKKSICNIHYSTQFKEGLLEKPVSKYEWEDLYDRIHPSTVKDLIKYIGIDTFNYQPITSLVDTIYMITGTKKDNIDIREYALSVVKEFLTTDTKHSILSNYTHEQVEQYTTHAKYYHMVMSNARKSGLNDHQLLVCENIVLDQIIIDMDNGVSGSILYESPSIVFFGHKLLVSDIPYHLMVSKSLLQRQEEEAEDYDEVTNIATVINFKRYSRYHITFKHTKLGRELYAIKLCNILNNQWDTPHRVVHYEMYREVGAIMVNELMLGDNSLTDWEKVKEHLT